MDGDVDRLPAVRAGSEYDAGRNGDQLQKKRSHLPPNRAGLLMDVVSYAHLVTFVDN